MQFIDLSIPITTKVVSDPPVMLPQIEYVTHETSWAQIAREQVKMLHDDVATVLARTAAQADVAATLIANAVDVPDALKRVTSCGGEFKMLETSFFLSRQTLLASAKPGMAIWREKLFAWMLRNAASAMEFFRLPTNRVVELGSQLEI